jgi:hypothetical protein
MHFAGLYRFRRVRVVERAVANDGLHSSAVRKDPLRAAWLIAHRDLLQLFEASNRWFVPVERYWSLFELHRDEPWAEEVAIAAARTFIPSDECTETCVLFKISQTWARYWVYFPRGTIVSEALTRATDRAKYAGSFDCSDGQPDITLKLTGDIRRTLGEVTAREKKALLSHLEEIERSCSKRLPPR